MPSSKPVRLNGTWVPSLWAARRREVGMRIKERESRQESQSVSSSESIRAPAQPVDRERVVANCFKTLHCPLGVPRPFLAFTSGCVSALASPLLPRPAGNQFTLNTEPTFRLPRLAVLPVARHVAAQHQHATMRAPIALRCSQDLLCV